MTMLDDRAVNPNGHMPPPDERRNRFGDRDNQTVPASWADDMLTRLNELHPAIFRDLLYHAATGNELAEATRTRARRQ